METTDLKLKLISFKQLGLGLFFLLLSLQLQLQLHLLLALPQNPMVADVNHGKIIGRKPTVTKKLSLSVKLGSKHEMKAVGRRGGAVGGRGGGGEHGSAGNAAGDNGGRSTKSPDGQGGALIPVYAAGSVNHHRHGSSSGTINSIGSSCLI